MGQLVNFFIFVMLLPLLFSFWVEGVALLPSILDSGSLKWFGAGLFTYVLVRLLLGGPIFRFIETAAHELIHAWVGRLCLMKPTKLEAASEGGGKTTFESTSNFLVLLAPYCFPVFTLVLLPIKAFNFARLPPVSEAINFLIGLTFGFHILLHIAQFGFRQTDVQKVGLIASVGFVYTFLLIFLIIILCVVMDSCGRIADYFAASGMRALDYYGIVIQVLLDLLNRAEHP
jgi:hypothetical protein